MAHTSACRPFAAPWLGALLVLAAGCDPEAPSEPPRRLTSPEPPAASGPTPGGVHYGHDLNTTVGPRGKPTATSNPPPVPLTRSGVLRWRAEPRTPDHLGRRATQREIQAAFDAWATALQAAGAPVKLVPAREDEAPDIVVGFRAGDHLDPCGGADRGVFTHPAGTMAHSFDAGPGCPEMRGAIHLNESLPWTLNGTNRKGEYDLRTVLTHEIGHLLGLPHHTTDTGVVMFETYSGIKWQIPEREARLVGRAMPEEAP